MVSPRHEIFGAELRCLASRRSGFLCVLRPSEERLKYANLLAEKTSTSQTPSTGPFTQAAPTTAITDPPPQDVTISSTDLSEFISSLFQPFDTNQQPDHNTIEDRVIPVTIPTWPTTSTSTLNRLPISATESIGSGPEFLFPGEVLPASLYSNDLPNTIDIQPPPRVSMTDQSWLSGALAKDMDLYAACLIGQLRFIATSKVDEKHSPVEELPSSDIAEGNIDDIMEGCAYISSGNQSCTDTCVRP